MDNFHQIAFICHSLIKGLMPELRAWSELQTSTKALMADICFEVVTNKLSPKDLYLREFELNWIRRESGTRFEELKSEELQRYTLFISVANAVYVSQRLISITEVTAALDMVLEKARTISPEYGTLFENFSDRVDDIRDEQERTLFHGG